MYPKTLQVTAVVAFYMTAALVMVFVNKAVLNSSPELPLLFLFVQLTLAVILLHAGALVTNRIEIPRLELDTAKKLVPVVLVNIIGLIFNTLCLRDVEASFFQIARGLVLPLTISVSSAYTHKSPPAKVIIAAAIVSFGFFLGVTPSSNVPVNAAPSMLSLFYGIMSSLFIAFHAVFIKSSLPHCNNSTIQLAYWTNAGSAIFLIPFILLRGEQMLLQELTTTEAPKASVFFWGSLVTGVFGFLLCVAGLLSIKITSPITHMFSSALRSVLQTVLGVLIFHDILTVNRAVSIFVTLVGTMYYTWIKSVENSPMPPHRGTDPELGKGDRAKDDAMLLQEREKNPNDVKFPS